MTAKANNDEEIAEQYQRGRTCAILSSDLSSAFDLVDHSILLKKMEFYGVVGKEAKFFKSFF